MAEQNISFIFVTVYIKVTICEHIGENINHKELFPNLKNAMYWESRITASQNPGRHLPGPTQRNPKPTQLNSPRTGDEPRGQTPPESKKQAQNLNQPHCRETSILDYYVAENERSPILGSTGKKKENAPAAGSKRNPTLEPATHRPETTEVNPSPNFFLIITT